MQTLQMRDAVESSCCLMQQDCPNMTEIEQPPTIKSAAVFACYRLHRNYVGRPVEEMTEINLVAVDNDIKRSERTIP